MRCTRLILIALLLVLGIVSQAACAPKKRIVAQVGGNSTLGGAAALTSPIELDNLSFWVQADATDTSALWTQFARSTHPVSTSDPIEVFDDLSGALNHFVVPSSADALGYDSVVNRVFASTAVRPELLKPETSPTTFLDTSGSTPFSGWTILDHRSSLQWMHLTKKASTNAFTDAGWAFYDAASEPLLFVMGDGTGHIKVRCSISSPTSGLHMSGFSYDGSGDASGVTIYLLGTPSTFVTQSNTFTGSASNTEPMNVGGMGDLIVHAGGSGKYIGEAGMTSDVITAAEFLQLYNNYWTPRYGL